MFSPLTLACCRRFVSRLVFLALAMGLRAAEDLHPVTRAHIESLLEEKAARSPAERKLDSQLVYFAKQSRNLPITAAVPTMELPVQANVTSGLPEAAPLGTDWTFTYTRPASVTDVTYVVEVSTNLSTWTSVGVTHAPVSTNGTTETWRGSYPLGSAPNVFFRLKVTQP